MKPVLLCAVPGTGAVFMQHTLEMLFGYVPVFHTLSLRQARFNAYMRNLPLPLGLGVHDVLSLDEDVVVVAPIRNPYASFASALASKGTNAQEHAACWQALMDVAEKRLVHCFVPGWHSHKHRSLQLLQLNSVLGANLRMEELSAYASRWPISGYTGSGTKPVYAPELDAALRWVDARERALLPVSL